MIEIDAFIFKKKRRRIHIITRRRIFIHKLFSMRMLIVGIRKGIFEVLV